MMDHKTFIEALRGPMMVWTLAHGANRAMQAEFGVADKGAKKRMENAQDKIDQLVLERAEAIKHEKVNGKIESGDF